MPILDIKRTRFSIKFLPGEEESKGRLFDLFRNRDNPDIIDVNKKDGTLAVPATLQVAKQLKDTFRDNWNPTKKYCQLFAIPKYIK